MHVGELWDQRFRLWDDDVYKGSRSCARHAREYWLAGVGGSVYV